MIKKAFITGCAGLIGSSLCDRILENYSYVVGVDDLSSGEIRNLYYASTHIDILSQKRFKFIQCKTQEFSKYEEYIKDCNIIFHMSSSMGVKNVLDNAIDISYNIDISDQVIFRLARKYNIPIIYASSSEVYGAASCPKDGYIESQILSFPPPNNYRSIYAASKLTGEYNLHYLYDRFKVPFIVLRFFNVVGIRQTIKTGLVLPSFISAAKNNKPIKVFGTGEQQRSFCNIKDCVNLIINLVYSNGWNTVYNVGNIDCITIHSLATLVKDILNSKSSIEFIDYKKAYNSSGFREIDLRIPNINKLISIVGQYSFKNLIETIREF